MNESLAGWGARFRALSPARIFVAISSLGTMLLGIGYLFAPTRLIEQTVLYQGLQDFGSVRPFAAWTVFVGFMILLSAIRNKRGPVARWSFIGILIWLFIGVLFAMGLPDSWFTTIVLLPMNLLALLYGRYLAMRPPNKDDDKFDEHVDKTRQDVLDLSKQSGLEFGSSTVS